MGPSILSFSRLHWTFLQHSWTMLYSTSSVVTFPSSISCISVYYMVWTSPKCHVIFCLRGLEEFELVFFTCYIAHLDIYSSWILFKKPLELEILSLESGDSESTFLFLLNLLGWHWLIKLYRFQVYDSIMHHLFIVFCVFTTPSQVSFSYLPARYPSGNHHMGFLRLWGFFFA